MVAAGEEPLGEQPIAGEHGGTDAIEDELVRGQADPFGKEQRTVADGAGEALLREAGFKQADTDRGARQRYERHVEQQDLRQGASLPPLLR
jgi:hypothetical protein